MPRLFWARGGLVLLAVAIWAPVAGKVPAGSRGLSTDGLTRAEHPVGYFGTNGIHLLVALLLICNGLVSVD